MKNPMPNMRPIPFSTLARSSRQAEKRASTLGLSRWTDDLSHLNASKRASWQRVLSSVATSETLEGTLLGPLLEAKKQDPEVVEYLEAQSTDERRHFTLLTSYLKNTFGYEKMARTLPDRVLYDGVFPKLASVFRRKPLYGFALLYCYEKFSLSFYGQLRAEAQRDGAQNLLTLIKMIEKDEHRHVGGMEQLIRDEIAQQDGLRVADVPAIRAILEIMLLDVDMRPWAIHNREVRKHLKNLGFDTDEMTRIARGTADATLKLMSAIEGEIYVG